MKSILLSIKPKYVAKILNGEKTIEIRKRFPADYVGWVYIYCTKGKLNLISEQDYNEEKQTWEKPKYYLVDYGDKYSLNGKVVARFYCDKVEEIKNNLAMCFFTETFNEKELLKKSCLNGDQLFWYLAPQELKVKCCGYAIHITKLEIFDKPKDISEFKRKVLFTNCNKCQFRISDYLCENHPNCTGIFKLTKAPQSWCYIKES